MTDERTFFDMIIHPTYEETMALHEASREWGELLLFKAGYIIGDTVYMDGQIEAVIHSASAPFFEGSLTITVMMHGDSVAEHLGASEFSGKPKVIIPCSIHNFTKKRLSEDNQKRWDWIKKRGLLGTKMHETIFTVPLELLNND